MTTKREIDLMAAALHAVRDSRHFEQLTEDEQFLVVDAISAHQVSKLMDENRSRNSFMVTTVAGACEDQDGERTMNGGDHNELPPGWEWDPERVGAYRSNSSTARAGDGIVSARDQRETDANPTDETMAQAAREVIAEAWTIHDEMTSDLRARCERLERVVRAVSAAEPELLVNYGRKICLCGAGSVEGEEHDIDHYAHCVVLMARKAIADPEVTK